MFCLHILVYILSSCRIDLMVINGYWLKKLPELPITLVLFSDLGPSSELCVLQK